MEQEKDTKLPGQTFDGGITEVQISQWKNKHRRVYRIDVVDEGDLFIGYFKRPSLDTMRAITQVSKTDETKAAEILFDNCWLGGAEEMRHDALLFAETQKQLAELLNSCRSSLKNL